MDIHKFLSLTNDGYITLTDFNIDLPSRTRYLANLRNGRKGGRINHTRSQMSLIASALTKCINLKTLYLHSLLFNLMNKKSFHRFLSFIRINVKLTKILFNKKSLNSFSITRLEELAIALKNIKLRSITLHGCNIAQQSRTKTNALIKLLSNCVFLEELDLSFNDLSKLTPEEWEELKNSLMKTKLKALYLNNIQIIKFNDKSIECLINLLRTCSSLEELAIGFNNLSNISKEQWSSFGQALKKTKIKKLIISGTNISRFSREKIIAFGEALSQCDSLEEIDLTTTDFSQFTIEQLIELRNIIQKLNIKILKMTGCRIELCTPQAREQLFNLINDCKSLESLSLNRNNLSMLSEEELATIGKIFKSKKIKTLDLSNISLEDFSSANLETFFNILDSLQELKHFYFDFNIFDSLKRDDLLRLSSKLNILSIETLSLRENNFIDINLDNFTAFIKSLITGRLSENLKLIDITDEEVGTKGLKATRRNVLIDRLMKCPNLRQLKGFNSFFPEDMTRLYASPTSPLIISKPQQSPELGLQNTQILFCFYASIINLLNECGITSIDLQRKILKELAGNYLHIVEFLLNNPSRVNDRKVELNASEFFPCSTKPILFRAKRPIDSIYVASLQSQPEEKHRMTKFTPSS